MEREKVERTQVCWGCEEGAVSWGKEGASVSF